MATCPKCGTELPDEYGMSKCPACGAFSFIDLEGIAVISEPDAEHVEAQIPSGAASPPDFSDPIEELLETPSTDFQAEPEFVAEPSDEFASFDGFAEMPPIDAPLSADSNVAAEIASAVADTSTNDESAFGPANDPLKINEFANSEASSAKDGPWLFRVFISGIDTKEIRESIREVLEDSRFAWDSNEIFSAISKGHLAVNGLSPVKASILITRIKYLPVAIRWEQYAITQGPRS